MLISRVSTAKTGNEIASCTQVSSDSHHRSSRGALLCGSRISVGSYSQLRMGLGWAVAAWLGIALLAGAACDPLTGTGPGTAPDPKGYIHSDPASRAVVITLIAGYPAGDYQFNYNGYRDGTLVIGIPGGCRVTVQC